MRGLLAILSIFVIATFPLSLSAGLYLSGEYGMSKSTSTISILNGVSADSPIVSLGWAFYYGEEELEDPNMGFEFSWRNYLFEATNTVVGQQYAVKIDDTMIGFGLRYWIWYFCLKAGGMTHNIKSSGYGAKTATEIGIYAGGGLNIPLDSSFALFADATYLSIATDFNATEFSGGLRILF